MIGMVDKSSNCPFGLPYMCNCGNTFGEFEHILSQCLSYNNNMTFLRRPVRVSNNVVQNICCNIPGVLIREVPDNSDRFSSLSYVSGVFQAVSSAVEGWKTAVLYVMWFVVIAEKQYCQMSPVKIQK